MVSAESISTILAARPVSLDGDLRPGRRMIDRPAALQPLLEAGARLAGIVQKPKRPAPLSHFELRREALGTPSNLVSMIRKRLPRRNVIEIRPGMRIELGHSITLFSTSGIIDNRYCTLLTNIICPSIGTATIETVRITEQTAKTGTLSMSEKDRNEYPKLEKPQFDLGFKLDSHFFLHKMGFVFVILLQNIVYT